MKVSLVLLGSLSSNWDKGLVLTSVSVTARSKASKLREKEKAVSSIRDCKAVQNPRETLSAVHGIAREAVS